MSARPALSACRPSRGISSPTSPWRGFLSERFEVSRFVLFSSRASIGGGPYVVEAAYPLEDDFGANYDDDGVNGADEEIG
jgi:hypothetical protein